MPSAELHQSSAMGLAINVLAVFLAFIAAASSLSATQFPHGKTVVYKYYGDVKAGIIEPAPYASQFALEGLLQIKHETSDLTLNNAYYVSLTNVKTGMHNGMAAHYQRTKVLTPIDLAAKVIEDPFLMVYDENGHLQGVKIAESEPGWSRNMKMAMASMLQLDRVNMKIATPLKGHSFVTKENTIHGDCWVDYDVHVKDPLHPNNDEYVVTKFSSPKNCSGFDVHTFDHVDTETCEAEKEEPVNVASRRVFEIEKQGEDLIIKKLVAHGGSNYFPWNARSEAHYVLTNATITLERVIPVAEVNFPEMDFQSMPFIRDLTYRKPHTTYAPNSAIDITQGRRVIDQTTLVPKLKKMLGEAADYIEENHLEMKEPDWKHGQTMNRILQTMNYMDIGSFEQVFDAYQNPNTPRDVTIENIFLGMIPQVGTTASCMFTLNVIRMHKVSENKAIEMLAKLPLNVRVPTPKLLTQMEDLVKFGDSINIEVRKSAILCFSTLIYRTMKELSFPQENTRLTKNLQYFYEHVINEPTYEMKVVYLMAMRNIQVGNLHDILAPIIRGDVTVSEHPVHIRLLAIWAIEKSVEHDYHYAHDLLWPVMADKSLPVKLRIAAYEILMHQAKTMTDVLHLYWFMVYESNEHLYNYHHTTIKGIANSVDPCKLHLRELVRKIMRFTKIHETTRYDLSKAHAIDFKDELYNHAQKFKTAVILNEVTGSPEVMKLEHTITDARRPISNFEIRLHVLGFDKIMTLSLFGKFYNQDALRNVNVINLLKQAGKDLPSTRMIHADVVLLHRGQVVMAKYCNEQTIKRVYDEIQSRLSEFDHPVVVNHQRVHHRSLYEKHVTSDMGLPVVFESRVPIVASLKMNYNFVRGSSPMLFNVELDGKIWSHGDYSMSVYNPMADVWHAIRRSTAMDLSVPLRANIAYNKATGNVKLTLPRLPATTLSTGGILIHAKDCVTVNEDDTEALKKSCPTCRIMEDVTIGSSKKMNYQSSVDSKDTGLQYSMALFDCENGVTPVTLSADWYRSFTSERKNTWNNWFAHGIMAIIRQVKNMVISPKMGSCGALLKVEPSIVHPTSHVDISLRSSYEDVDHTNPSFHPFANEKYNIRGTMDVIAAATNTTSRSWDLNVNIDLNQGHLTNVPKMQITRTTPGEKSLKICVDAQKTYSPVPTDPLKLGATKEETNSKLTIAVGHTDEDKCVRDETLITMTLRGELSAEQKKKFNQEIATGARTADINNPLYENPKNIIPRTLNCLHDAIRYTTLRKYTVNIAHKNVPREMTSKIFQFEDVLRASLLPNLKYTLDHVETGNMKMKIEFPMEENKMDVSVVTPDRSYDLIDVNFEKQRYNGFGSVIRPLWFIPLDNTRFGFDHLFKYTSGVTKMCSVYPQIVLTGDGKDIPFTVPEQWTLVTGDHVNEKFAVFAKTIGNNMAVKIYRNEYVVEILPNVDNTVQVTVNGKVTAQLENGVLVSSDSNLRFFKITKSGHLINVQMNGIPITIVHGINHVALAISNGFEGEISGLCGHLDGTYVNKIPKTYTLTKA